MSMENLNRHNLWKLGIIKARKTWSMNKMISDKEMKLLYN